MGDGKETAAASAMARARALGRPIEPRELAAEVESGGLLPLAVARAFSGALDDPSRLADWAVPGQPTYTFESQGVCLSTDVDASRRTSVALREAKEQVLALVRACTETPAPEPQRTRAAQAGSKATSPAPKPEQPLRMTAEEVLGTDRWTRVPSWVIQLGLPVSAQVVLADAVDACWGGRNEAYDSSRTCERTGLGRSTAGWGLSRLIEEGLVRRASKGRYALDLEEIRTRAEKTEQGSRELLGAGTESVAKARLAKAPGVSVPGWALALHGCTRAALMAGQAWSFALKGRSMWASNSTLSGWLGCHVRTVQRSRSRLLALGVAVVSPSPKGTAELLIDAPSMLFRLAERGASPAVPPEALRAALAPVAGEGELEAARAAWEARRAAWLASRASARAAGAA